MGPLHSLVRSYLVHYGYAATVQALDQDAACGSDLGLPYPREPSLAALVGPLQAAEAGGEAGAGEGSPSAEEVEDEEESGSAGVGTGGGSEGEGPAAAGAMEVCSEAAEDGLQQQAGQAAMGARAEGTGEGGGGAGSTTTGAAPMAVDEGSVEEGGPGKGISSSQGVGQAGAEADPGEAGDADEGSALRLRRDVRQAIMKGDMDGALAAIRAAYPEVGAPA